jgi:hypothetical protein
MDWNWEDPKRTVATDVQVIHFHRKHRGPGYHSLDRGQFFA